MAVRRIELLSALGACVLGLGWLAMVVRTVQGLYTLGGLMSGQSDPLLGAAGLYFLGLAAALVLLPAGAYLHARGAEPAGVLLVWLSALGLLAGIVTYLLVPGTLVPWQLATVGEDVLWLPLLSVPAVVLGGVAAVAAITPASFSLADGGTPRRENGDAASPRGRVSSPRTQPTA